MRNYLQNVLVKTAMLPVIKADQADVVKKTGHSYKAFETGVSPSAAAIAVGDWTLELPQPIPPKLHVSH